MIKEFIMNLYDNRSLLKNIKRIYKSYKRFGLIYNEKDNNVYFNGKLVKKFYDERRSILKISKLGECNVKAIYDTRGALIGLMEY